MVAWRDVEQAVPEFAQRVRALFDAHKHKTIATLRAVEREETHDLVGGLGHGDLVAAENVLA